MKVLLRAAAAAGVIAGTLAVARGEEPVSVDTRATALLASSRGSHVDRIAGAVTDVGSVFGLTAISAVLALGGERSLGLRTAVSGSLAWAAAQATKELVDRRRPYELGTAQRLVSEPAGSSWPSGHAAVAAAMATTLAPALSPAGRRGAMALAATVAATRLHVGVHHLTDVAAGAAIGVLASDLTRLVRRASV